MIEFHCAGSCPSRLLSFSTKFCMKSIIFTSVMLRSLSKFSLEIGFFVGEGPFFKGSKTCEMAHGEYRQASASDLLVLGVA